MTTKTPFAENAFFHIYNRGNNREIIFPKEQNYKYFLYKSDSFLSKVLNVYAYCLLPNHFHFVVRIKSAKRMPSLQAIASTDPNEELSSIISEQFRKLFISYSQSINRQENRRGSLFQKPFKRKEIEDENQLINTIVYIHLNPVHHKVTSAFPDYPWSSYSSILNTGKTKFNRNSVIDIFDNRANYIDAHRHCSEYLIKDALE